MTAPYVFVEAGRAGPTATDIINRAGKRAKILADEAAFTASEAADALQLLNDMMHGFGPKGIQYAHVTLAATDTVNIPDEQIRNLVLMFTEELAMDFEFPLDDKLVAAIIDAKNELQAAYHIQTRALAEPLLRRRLVGHYDIARDQ